MSSSDPLLQEHVQYGTTSGIEGDESHDNIQHNLLANESPPRANDSETEVYVSRWYVLMIMSLAVALQNTCWGTWGPISQSATAVYGWNTSILAVMINCGNAGVLTFLLFAGYIVNKKGLRVSLLLTTSLLVLSPGIRAITFRPVVADILIGLGQYLAGIAGSFTQVSVTLVSETWFPTSERTTATTIAALSGAVGCAIAFLLGPAIVSQPDFSSLPGGNSTTISSLSNETRLLLNKIIMQEEIRKLNLIELGCGSALFLMTLLYFPKKPVKPPTLSAAAPRQDFKSGIIKLMRNINIWRISILCGIAFAVFLNWLGLLSVNLQHSNISQKQSGWFGFYAVVAGSGGGMIIGRLSGLCQRRIKILQIVLLGLSTAVAVWITCMRNDYIAHTNVTLGVAISLLGVLVFTIFPMNMEFACEIGYPVSEDIVCMFLGLTGSAVAVSFLVILYIPGVGINWTNWTLVGFLGIPVIFLCTFKERYNRMDVDLNTTDSV